MAARAIWKGVISFGSVELPVKLYSAVQDRDVHFRLLHEADRAPVKQHMVNPETGEIVPHEQIRKAYQDDDVLVMLDEEELESLEPEPSRTIEITRFVPRGKITPQWYDRPYYLGPDRSVGLYFALARALGQQKRHGIARWVMRDKEYVGALVPEGDYLMLMTLRHAEEVIPATSLPEPGGRAPDAKELKLAQQLISALEDEFDPAEFRDEYRDRVLEFIDAKSKGKAVKVKRFRQKKTDETSLASALEASLKASARKQKKSA